MSIYRLRPRGMRGTRHSLCALIFLLGALVAGCGGGGGSSRNDDYTGPKITWTYFQPSTIPDTGGTVRIMAQVTDASGLAWVRATLTRPDGTQQVLDLAWQSGGYYEASFQVPAYLPGDNPQYYAALSAADRNGNLSSASVGYLNVGGDDSGPPPPPNL